MKAKDFDELFDKNVDLSTSLNLSSAIRVNVENMTKNDAEIILSQWREASELCNQSLKTVMCHENLGIVKVYGRLIGLLLGESYTQILAPIWKKFPELEPAEMREPYLEPIATLSAQSQEAITECFASAKLALQLSANQGINDIENVAKSIVDIEAFIIKPRFRDEQ